MKKPYNYSAVFNLGQMIEAGMRKGVDFETDGESIATVHGIFFPAMNYWRQGSLRVEGSGEDFADFYFKKQKEAGK